MAFNKFLKMFITEYFNGWMRWKFKKFVSKFMFEIMLAAEEIIIALLKYLQSVQRGCIRIKFTKKYVDPTFAQILSFEIDQKNLKDLLFMLQWSY